MRKRDRARARRHRHLFAGVFAEIRQKKATNGFVLAADSDRKEFLEVPLGEQYDRIADWWNERHHDSRYGIDPLERAIRYCAYKERALDVGCGAGGRMIRKLIENGFNVTGLDISSRMLELAKQNNPEADFILDDICRWNTSRRFDLIVAWDSIFHLGMSLQKGVVGKLCDLLNTDGILIYSFGDDGDGVPDKVDRCPMEPETLNGVNDSDGSPD